MASIRARLLAAAILGGACAGPLGAQPPRDPVFAAQSFEVLPPRRLPMPNVPSAFNSQNVTVGFFSSTPAPPQPAANVTNPAPAGPTSWLNPPRAMVAPNPQGPTLMPLFGRPSGQNPLPHVAAPIIPAQAPAWRWHGYGSVNNGNVAPTTPAAAPTGVANPGLVTPDTPPMLILPMPTAAPMPMPPGPSLAPDSRTPGAMPSFVPSSGPVEAVPLPNSGNEPSWRPLNGRSGALPSYSSDLGIVRANVPADPLAAAPVAFIPAAVADPPPPQPAIPASTSEGPLVVLRSTIETLCAGRGRDLEMYHRGPNQLLIRLKVRVGADAERLAQLISKLPELALYQVTYEIAVAP